MSEQHHSHDFTGRIPPAGTTTINRDHQDNVLGLRHQICGIPQEGALNELIIEKEDDGFFIGISYLKEMDDNGEFPIDLM
jgi:hypothetical protein